ncbi:hypothetical protein ACFWZ2_22975 [Streptomyces sp. NPDC059002]|uniref:hypothetical protein n=1 Tax=Streptomyces sp. NPDC059002 TaxID=3346690 RepID=UPI003674F6EB
MPHCIARIFEPLLRLLLPSSGRHRDPDDVPADVYPVAPQTSRLLHAPCPVLRGEDVRLVRPYLVAFERCREERQQRARRRALWLALHGVDVGPRWIHGVEVMA